MYNLVKLIAYAVIARVTRWNAITAVKTYNRVCDHIDDLAYDMFGGEDIGK